jgi:hypothetical protein
MIITRQSIIHCHSQEFFVGAIGDKIIVKAYLPVIRKTKRKQPRSIQEFNICHKANSHKKEMMVSV